MSKCLVLSRDIESQMNLNYQKVVYSLWFYEKKNTKQYQIVICWYSYKICNISRVPESSLLRPPLSLSPLSHQLTRQRRRPREGLWFRFPPSQSVALHLALAKRSRSCLQVLQEVWWKKWYILDFSLWESPSQLRCPPGVKLLGRCFSRTKEINPFSRRGWHIHMAMCYSQF